MMLLVEFNVKSVLPTLENNATWHMPITSQATLTLPFDAPLFSNPKASIGMYTLGVHSKTSANYFLSLFEVKRSAKGED